MLQLRTLAQTLTVFCLCVIQLTWEKDNTYCRLQNKITARTVLVSNVIILVAKE